MTNIAPIARRPAPAVRVSRIVFQADGFNAAAGQRQFKQPRHAVAFEEAATLEGAAADANPARAANECFVIFIPRGSPREAYERARALLALPEPSESTRSIVVERNGESIAWRAGLAVLSGREEGREEMVKALVDFTFYEGELRALEQSVEAAEHRAQTDVALAHRIRYRDRKEWERLTDCTERCSRMRLTFARLEPHLYTASRTLPPTSRRWIFRLFQKSDVESRLEALSDRLEALEDLYEAAHQRIAEFRWYREGHLLEICIILLLLVECALMAADLHQHRRDR